jgi:adenylosuccinate synthase
VQEGKFNVLIDQAHGSSGKGAVSTRLADVFSVTNVSSANMPNAGHSAAFPDRKFVAKAIPTAAILKAVKGMDMTCWVSPGSGFTWAQLVKEWEECGRPTLKIHGRASIVTPGQVDRERVGFESTAHIASTMQGSGTALADKLLRRPGVALAGNTPESFKLLTGVELDPDGVSVLRAEDFRDEVQSRILDGGQTWLHEGSQGYALSLDHGNQYPACLSGDSRVLMADGSTKKIRKILVGDVVLSMDESGKTVPKKVQNFWRKETGSKTWYNVVTETSVFNPHDQQWVGPKLTGDHRVMTTRGKVETRDLKRGDQVFVNESEIVGDGLQVFLGSMLGDGTVPACKKNKHRAKIQLQHGPKQAGYLSAKASILRDYIGGSERTVLNGHGSFKEGGSSHRYESSASLSVMRVATRLGCYGNKKPDMKAIVESIDVRGLAIWFQDDGRFKRAVNGPEVIFYTNGFSKEECSELCKNLSAKFDMTFSVNVSGKDRDGSRVEEPTVRLSRHDHDRWFSMISRYVHPDLQYKLPDGFRAGWSWNDRGDVRCMTETVIDIVTPRDFRTSGLCYDIEVEDTHNFFVKNDKGAFNVENCTSRNCTVQAAMDYMAIPPRALGDVYLNLRTFPIRVGNLQDASGAMQGYSGDFYPDQEELTWDEVARRAGMPDQERLALAERERTTVTKRIRRVATFSWIGLRDAVRTNGVTKICVNFPQYLDWADAGLRGGPERLKDLSPRTREFIERVEHVANVPVVMVGTGALHDDFISLA